MATKLPGETYRGAGLHMPLSPMDKLRPTCGRYGFLMFGGKGVAALLLALRWVTKKCCVSTAMMHSAIGTAAATIA